MYIEKEDLFMTVKTSRKLSLWIIGIVAFTIGGCSMSLTGNQPAATVENTPMYKKEVIISTGYANISTQKSKNPAQRRLMAIRASKLDAYRSLAEQVYGQQINASTTVEDMIIANDTMRAHVAGVVYGAKVVSINILQVLNRKN